MQINSFLYYAILIAIINTALDVSCMAYVYINTINIELVIL